MSISKTIKTSVKSAVKFVDDFEQKAIDMAVKKGVDYVVCGHIHRPQMRSYQQNGRQVMYLNSGDWVEHLTALEYNWGSWSIYKYDPAEYANTSSRLYLASSQLDSQDELEAFDAVAIWKELAQKTAFQ